MTNMNLKTFRDSLDGYTTGIYGTDIVKYYAAGNFENKSDSRSLVPGNQNGSGYKYISLEFSTTENLDIYIYIILQYLKP